MIFYLCTEQYYKQKKINICHSETGFIPLLWLSGVSFILQ